MKIKINSAHTSVLFKDKVIFLNFLKSIIPVFHKSNVFFRDIQYGVQKYLLLKGLKVSNEQAEVLAAILIKELVEENIFFPLNAMTWVVNYPPYTTGAPHTYEVAAQEAQQ
jgi:hypothetical protein